jgi:hypothetical protein
MSQKTELFITTAVRISNPTKFNEAPQRKLLWKIAQWLLSCYTWTAGEKCQCYLAHFYKFPYDRAKAYIHALWYL